MMSQKEKMLLKKKIITARSVLMRNNPFFAMLLMHIRFVALLGMEQLSTNGETIFFSPELMKKYTTNELIALLCHQMMHILKGDIWRRAGLKGDEFHYMCDCVVNEQLAACGIGTYYVYVREIPPIEKGFGDIQRRRMVDTDEFWGYELYNVKNGVVILETEDDIWSQLEQTEEQKKSSGGDDGGDVGKGRESAKAGTQSEIQAKWAGLVEEYCGVGKIPQGIERLRRGKPVAQLDWKKLLSDFIQEETFDYSFCPPDRRFDDGDFFLPDFNEKNFMVKNILFMVDTSGSITEYDLAVVFTEIQHAIDLFNGNLSGLLGFFDADVTEPQPFTNVEDIANIIPYGGGGTDFRPIFKYIAENCSSQLPSCVVIYTDGFGDFPRKRDTLGVPVLWLINNDEVTPPFGKVARVLSI